VTDRLLSTTRAVRRRLDLARPVPREVILDCIRLAQQAPTGSNAQSWRGVVVTDAARRPELARLDRDGGSVYLEMAAKQAEGADAQTRRVYDSALWLLEHLAEVPVHVVPCVMGRPPAGAPPVAHASVYASIYPAVWSFQLALRSRGLGSVLTTLHLFREAEAADILGIPATVTQVAMLPVAYTKGTDFKPAARRPAREVTYWNAWKVPRTT